MYDDVSTSKDGWTSSAGRLGNVGKGRHIATDAEAEVEVIFVFIRLCAFRLLGLFSFFASFNTFQVSKNTQSATA